MATQVTPAEMLSRSLLKDKEMPDEEIIRVAGGADTQSVATAIAAAFYDGHEVTVRCVGASAVNQAVKAMAIARGYVASRGVDMVVRPGFINVPGRDGTTISAIIFRIKVE